MKKRHKSTVDFAQVIGSVPPTANTWPKAAAYGFLLVGSSLVILSFILSIGNNSLSAWIGTIFFQFLPGLILIISGVKVLKT